MKKLLASLAITALVALPVAAQESSSTTGSSAGGAGGGAGASMDAGCKATVAALPGWGAISYTVVSVSALGFGRLARPPAAR